MIGWGSIKTSLMRKFFIFNNGSWKKEGENDCCLAKSEIKVSGNNFDDGKLFSIFMTTIVEIMGVSSVNSSS